MKATTARRGVALAAVLLTVSTPLAADWLVLKDGSGRVETKGTWEVRGAQVLFHRPNGVLSSLRATDVDLEASKRATEDAAKPPAPAAKPTPAPASTKPVIEITDADVGHVEDTPAAAPAETAAPAVEAAPAAAANRLRVTEWHQDLQGSAGGVTLVGEVTNFSKEVVGDINVVGKLLDDKGKLIATADALLGTSTLQPGDKTILRATFPGVFVFTTAQFEPQGLALRSHRSAPASGGAAAGPEPTPPPPPPPAP